MKERNTLDSEETVKHGGFEEEFQLVLLLLLLLSRQPSEDHSDLRRQLVMAKELGVPVSRVNLINGSTLQNVIVKEVLSDLAVFQNPLNHTRSNVAISSIVSWGAF
ncbi:spore biosynthesis protein CgeC [Bacillus velezensis]|nr:spore biosynthesis protein CgeC [Bacillus sp. EKM601B]MBA9150370.1 spore biosynthesis protein CgeC [Bacillus sp. EKM213B]MBD8887762.1 spore biosynthesis protein CgeC [Bacillus velezensis]MBR7816915.1 spore biosynthesis protein CgeC [Bacillus sp. CCNWLCWHY013]MCD5428743.1 spore biosynthesis protein CgeC [Bacillus amyloliquefaciens]